MLQDQPAQAAPGIGAGRGLPRRPRLTSFGVGLALFGLIAALSLLAPHICPHDPSAQSLMKRLQSPSLVHWLGTDHLGRDVASCMLNGGRFAILIALTTLVVCVVSGTVIGIFSARRGGLVDDAIMRIVDFLISLPDIVLALVLTALLGTSYLTLIVALSIAGWTPFARVARGLALDLNSRDFVRAAEVLGCSERFIIFRHIVPNLIRPIAAITFLRFGHKLITVGGLSFIGLGVQPPTPDWAAMMAESQAFIDRAPWLVICPGLAVFLTALSVTWIGQGLERRFDGAAP